ncbi:hypothetical protein MMC26_006388 [Xylographa opegraphella]|nr:hypothetical protein [Xylographa opegraphella]
MLSENTSSPLRHDAYDIIIVGGGTAGCVLANRLTEDPALTVLILEAGPNKNDDPRVYTPALFGPLMGDPDFDWQYVSEPQSDLHGRSIHHPRGKVLGGSSVINLLALIYPTKAGLDAWAELGNNGWDWDSMAPYFRKFQTFVPPSQDIKDFLRMDYIDPTFQGSSGPIQSSFPNIKDPIQRAWVEAHQSIRHGLQADPLSGHSLGGYSSPCAITGDTKERSHAGKAYYGAAKDRPNLHLITAAQAEKVNFEPSVGSEDAIASGVKFSYANTTYNVRARKEVILAAGVFASPQLLELSGVGSSKILESHGIEVVYDNTYVGENLQDHMMCGSSFEVNDGVRTMDLMRDPAVVQAGLKQYNESRSGPLAQGPCYSFAFVSLNTAAPDSNATTAELLDKYLRQHEAPTPFPAAKIQYDFNSRMIESPDEATATHFLARRQFHLDKSYPREIMAAYDSENYISTLAMLSYPFSRGSVHIRSPAANVPPVIDFKYLSHPLDAELYGRHMMFHDQLIETESLSRLIKPNGRRLPPGKDSKTLENAIELIRSSAATNYHPCGTCAMMRKELGGVVSDRLVVYGTRNLRVVDASIMPIIPRGNIMTSVYALAEKGADLIKEDLGLIS